jgi:Nif-specific regulatory protein
MPLSSSATVATGLLELASQETETERYLPQSLQLLALAFGIPQIGLVRGDAGRWTMLGTSGAALEPPDDLLSDALDRESPAAAGGWLAIPLDPRRGDNELLVASGSKPKLSGAVQELADVATAFHTALRVVRQRQRIARRLARVDAMLEIAAQWNQPLEMNQLLVRMAEASTRLLAAERASIFLWDRQSKTLVGRPALGIEGDELRIPDDAGVVGDVVQSGQPRRVGPSQDAQDIDRTVDKQLKFQTRSLLCVPLRTSNGELLGAFELINKRKGEFTASDEEALIELAGHASNALEATQQREQLLRVRDHMVDEASQGARLLGDCPSIEALRSTIQRVSSTDLAVLILGENGTGKEVVAQRIHYLSDRRHEPFVAVNCAALPETLLESELFGHEKGAFTDASETRAGKFELATGGTLFLDEIGDMSLGGQAKLLRVLEEKVVVHVGGSTPIHTDARVIAATNQKLAELVREKRFREDLYYRLNVVTLEIPPLRERDNDVLMLAEHFLEEFSARAGRHLPKFTAAARRRLTNHNWPGNVRELRNLMERLAYLLTADKIDAEDLSFILSPSDGETPLFTSDLTLAEATKTFQAQYVRKQIDRSRGNMTEVAERLGLHRSNLYRKMRQLDMPDDG